MCHEVAWSGLPEAIAMNCPVCTASEAHRVGEKNGYRIQRCAGCGLMYADPMPTPDELDGMYAEYGVNRKNIQRKNEKVRRWVRRLFLIEKLAPAGRSLDIGCNTGFATEAARRYGYEAHGIDLGRESIEIARELFPECRFELLTAQELAERDESFELVTCPEVIEHLTEVQSFARALAALTRPGGILYLTTPDAGHPLVPRDPLSWKEICPPHHLIYFGRPQIRRLLEAHGFKVLFFFPMLHKPSLRLVARRL